MKILATNAFTEEKVELKKWAEINNQDLTITDTPLTADNVAQVKGFDALSVQQVVPLGGPEVYQKLAAYGIKQIAVRSVGYEFIDLQAAKANGLTVTNVPVYSPKSVAEYVLGQSMRLFRNFNKFDADVAKHDFTWLGKISPEFSDLTVGIIGAGHIGSAVAKIFNALGATVLVDDPIQYDDVAKIAKYVSLEDVLKYSDIVTLHVPLTEDTTHMINATTLAQMKPTAYLVNAARGAVTKTADLIAALKANKIAGAALDVLENEGAYFDYDWQGQPLDNPELETLLELPNVILTPHIAFFTKHSVHNIAFTALDDAFLGASGKTVKNPVLS